MPRKAAKDKSHFEPYILSGPFQGRRRCQHFRSDGKTQCGNAAVKGADACAQTHSGGKGGAPIKHGKRSKLIPKGIDAAVERILKDPELLSLNEEIAVVRARLEIVREKVRTAEREKQDLTQFWPEWNELVDQLMKLTAAENKRQAQLASSLNAKEANVLKTLILAVLIDVCKDETIPRSQIAKVVGLKLISKMS